MKELREVIEGTKFTLGLSNRELGQHLGFGRRYIDKVLREGVTTQKQIELIERINQLDSSAGFDEIDGSDKIKSPSFEEMAHNKIKAQLDKNRELEQQIVMLQKDNDYFVKTNAELRKQIGQLEFDVIGVDMDNHYRALALQIELDKANQEIDGTVKLVVDEQNKALALKNECEALRVINSELEGELAFVKCALVKSGETVEFYSKEIDERYATIGSLKKREENLSWLCLLLAVCWMATVVFYQVF